MNLSDMYDNPYANDFTPDDFRLSQVRQGDPANATSDDGWTDAGNGIQQMSTPAGIIYRRRLDGAGEQWQTTAPGMTFEQMDHPQAGSQTGTLANDNRGGVDTGGLPKLSGRVTDAASIRKYVDSWAGMEGADPSLKNDPDYWVRRITETGGLGDDNTQYWQNAGVGPTAFFRNPNREAKAGEAAPPSGAAAGGGSGSGSGYDLASYFTKSPLLAPWTQQFSYADWKAPDAFSAPTTVDEENDPGYKFRMQQAQQALERAAAAKGTLLTGGTATDLATLMQNLGSQEYGNVYNRKLGEWQLGYDSSLNDWTTNYNKALQGYQQSYNIFENNQAKQYNRISNLAGLGQTAAGSLNSAGLGYSNLFGNTSGNAANNLGNIYTGIGNAKAAGTVGGGNALSNAFGSVTDLAGLYASGGFKPNNQSSYGNGFYQDNA